LHLYSQKSHSNGLYSRCLYLMCALTDEGQGKALPQKGHVWWLMCSALDTGHWSCCTAKRPHHIVNGKTHHAVQNLHKHTPPLKHYLKLSSVCVCIKLYNLQCLKTRRVQWRWNVGQPTSFSCDPLILSFCCTRTWICTLQHKQVYTSVSELICLHICSEISKFPCEYDTVV
jgi:hypothetical protein